MKPIHLYQQIVTFYQSCASSNRLWYRSNSSTTVNETCNSQHRVTALYGETKIQGLFNDLRNL